MSTVEKLIAAKNRETAVVNRRSMVKRSSDTQMLNHLTKTARVAIDAFFSTGRDCTEAMKELRSFVVLAERNHK